MDIKPHVKRIHEAEAYEALALNDAVQNILNAWHAALFLAEKMGRQDVYDELAAVFGISGIIEAPRLTAVLGKVHTEFHMSIIGSSGRQKKALKEAERETE